MYSSCGWWYFHDDLKVTIQFVATTDDCHDNTTVAFYSEIAFVR